MAAQAVTVKTLDSVAVIRIDDGRANAVSGDLADELWLALEVAEADSRAVVLTGRTGVFCGGLDLQTLLGGGHATTVLAHKASEICLRLAEFPRPVVAACTGHAVAYGATLLLCCDYRIGAEGDYRIGFNEVSIGVPIPELLVGLARERLANHHLTRALSCAEMYPPHEAAEAGFLDRAHSMSVIRDAVEKAAEMADRLDPAAFAATRKVMTQRLGEAVIRQAAAFMRLRDRAPAFEPNLTPRAAGQQAGARRG